ncbi:flagellar protein FlgN [Amorphus sp. 3PC139-8]|uniref:flagellar protein FlgN n=1 Tax=Amorphus sp. 3PC139-8 TaxID=2735676 RepID=UPI00345DF3F1
MTHSHNRSGYTSAVASVLDRLDQILDVEIAALSHPDTADLSLVCRQKSRLLLELSRLVREDEPVRSDTALAARLTEVREKLVRDQSLLSVHLAATEEISELIAQAMREAESDGTYTAPLAATEARP